MSEKHDENGWLPAGPGAVGPLTIAAILRGNPHAALRHRLKDLKDTAWGKVADNINATQNGNSAEKLTRAMSGIRLPGMTEDASRRHMLGEIFRWDGFVDAWLENDPEFTRRKSLPSKTAKEVSGLFDDTKWVWDQWIPRGYLSMMAGRPGAGKSYIAAWIASNLISGGLLPDRTHADSELNGSSVMWIDTESTHSLLIQRLKVMASPSERFFWPLDPKNPSEPFPAVDLSKPYWSGIVTDLAIERKPCLIVVDSLRGSHGMDENSSDVQHMLGVAAAIARDVGCAFLFIHHLRKKSPGEHGEVTLDQVRGSSAITAMMRVVFAVDQPDPLSNETRLRVIKSNLGTFADPVGIQIEEHGPVALSFAPKVPKPMSVVDRAVEFLKAKLEQGPRAQQDLMAEAEELGISKSTMRRAQLKLNVVAVKMQDHWEWSLPAKEGQGPPF